MRNTAVTGTIDPLVNLRKSSVLLVSGANDTVVQQGVVRSLRTLLQSFLPNESIHTEFTLPAEHAAPSTTEPHEVFMCREAY